MKCKTCIYHSYIAGSYNSTLICQYILITGHMRGCPAGDECIRYEKGKRLKVNNFNKHKRL